MAGGQPSNDASRGPAANVTASHRRRGGSRRVLPQGGDVSWRRNGTQSFEAAISGALLSDRGEGSVPGEAAPGRCLDRGEIAFGGPSRSYV